MRNLLLASLAVAAVATSAACAPAGRDDRALPRMAQDYPIRPVPFTRVHVDDAFWAPRLETNRTVTIPYAFEKCEETGRISNFAVAGGLAEGTFRGTYFNDSDVYKVLEGAAYALANQRDPKLEAYVDDLIAKIAAAQEDDGYLYTSRTILNPKKMPPGGKERWSNISGGHELYCVGHLYEAAVAHYQATGKRTLIDVALANADLICRVFGPDGRHDPPGHQEIEIGLAKLYRITGERKYLALAKFFLDVRGREDGRKRLYGAYSQDHEPVVEQTEAVGHAVRAAYMYSGMADVAALTGDASYTEAIGRIWHDVVGAKMYVTGGIGARGGGEGFGRPYELPNSAAYCETCASIAHAMWNHRLFLIHGDATYLDVLERTVYNAFLGGVSIEGNRFFYPNRLESFGGERRAEWFGCACCPSNVCRFVPSIPGYVYAHRGGDLYVNLFIAGTGTVEMAERTVRLTQATRYPWEGTVTMTVAPDRPGRFAVLVRIPGWARNRPVPSGLYRYIETSAAKPTVKVNGREVPLALEKGFARVEREWKKGDTIALDLPMPVRRTVAHEKVLDDAGRVAVERGPIVFCAEGVDHADGQVLPLVLDDAARLKPAFREDLLGGVTVLAGTARAAERQKDGSAKVAGERGLTLIPYYARAHRDVSQMTVWPARRPEAAKPLAYPTIARRSKVTASANRNPEAIIDQLIPRSSIDHGVPFLHWWPRKGEQEWVELAFAEPARIKGVEVYWFDDTGIGACRLPASWRLKVKTGGQWRDAAGAKGFGCEKDRFNRATFDPVTAEGVRLEIQGPETFSVGIHEVRIIPAEGAAAAPATPAKTDAAKADKPAASAAKKPEAKNLLANASFEKAAKKGPAGWNTGQWSGKGRHGYADTGRTGGRSVMIESADGGDIAWTATAGVQPFARYRLSGWIRTEDVKTTKGGRGALLNLHNLQPAATKALKGTKDWTRVAVEFDIEDQDAVQVNCLLGGWGLATGKAWYDDLRLEKIGERAVPKPAIRIDAAKTGEPISKYVYGQFIEHLGRCIYGGIWAEMLEDRKFYYPVTAKYDPYGGGRRPTEEAPLPVVKASPWQISGSPDSVTMVKKDSFVGDHTPRIAVGSGIAQHDLALRKGKEYVGHVWLKPADGKSTVRVSLCWGDGPQERQTDTITCAGDQYAKSPLKFRAAADTDQATLRIEVAAGGPCFVGTASLMPADNVDGMRADTLGLLKELDSPVYRWPGGNFVSGYDWKDGIGPRDRRPPRKNPAWTGVEHNDFGLHEFLRFCEVLGTDPYIAVNSGLGGTDAAAQEVQYTNGAPDTPMGRMRAKNGHAEPWKVRFWGIGNEMYGGWQLGHMPLEKYVEKHNEFAEAMRKRDRSIQLVAVGAAGKWSETMMRHCAEAMDLISEHFYRHERPGLMGHVRQMPEAVRGKADAHRRYRREIEGLKEKDIDIALDEWNYWYGPHVFGELGTRYFLKDALGIAAGLHEMFRNSDLFYMANYAQTVNVIGAIKTTKTAAAMETTGLALAMYRHHFGTVPVATEVEGLVNAMAAWTDDRKALTVGVVNPTRQAAQVPLKVAGARLTGNGTRWVLAGDDPMAYNDPGRPPTVAIEEGAVRGADKALAVPAYSVTIFRLEVK